MGIQYRQHDSKTSGPAMDAPAREPSVRSRAGRTLRHWTTDLAFVGDTTTTASGADDWGLADGRQRNLLASRLKSLAGRVGAL